MVKDRVVRVEARPRIALMPLVVAVIWASGIFAPVFLLNVLQGSGGAEQLLTVGAALYVIDIAYGLIRSRHWWVRAGQVKLRVDDRFVVVSDSEGVQSRYPREEVLRCQVRGHYGWFMLLTAQPVNEFPSVRLVLRETDVHVGPLLLWGEEVDRAATELADALHDTRE